MEQTLVLIKPDGMEKQIVGKVIDRFERAGLKLRGLKLITLTQELLDTWYAHHKDKPFFPELSAFMKSRPVVAMVLSGENAVNKVRDLVGPTDSTKALKGTIRGDFGESIQKNIVHASDALERAEFEIKLLFTLVELFD
ncbi:TPA: nucleoside-diphosphate kinase [Patescibacteria group bacterium]|nr:nucleoside-diphosphate kinase [Patescibacteria group bacterium]